MIEERENERDKRREKGERDGESRFNKHGFNQSLT